MVPINNYNPTFMNRNAAVYQQHNTRHSIIRINIYPIKSRICVTKGVIYVYVYILYNNIIWFKCEPINRVIRT